MRLGVGEYDVVKNSWWKFFMSFRLHIVDIVTRVALGKQRQTYEYSSKRKLMDRCIGLSFGSMVAVVWGFWGS